MRRVALLLVGLIIGFRGVCQNDINNQLIFVKGGTFFMGCEDHEFLGEEYDDERPMHRVAVSSFYIMKHEVTNGEFRALMGIYPPAYNGVDYASKYCDNCPVVKISWDDAQEFIRKLNIKFPGKNYRLPTETEWEYAARGGKYTNKHMFSGDDRLGAVGWYGHRNGSTHPAASKAANELGIYDMSGNVAEWCADWYSEDYYNKTIDAIDPKGPAHGTKRVVRGGSYFDDDVVCRNVHRSKLPQTARQWDLGFRLAADYVPAKSDKQAE